MRIYADVNRLPDLLASETSSVILQTGLTPPVGTETPLNGRFVVPVPDGVTPPELTESSRLLDPVGPVDVLYQRLLANYPQFSHIRYNPLLNSAHLTELDAAAVFPNPPATVATQWDPRFQSGRGTGPGNGYAPLSLVVLPANTAVAVERPGLVITDTIDIDPETSGAGASTFLVYWKVYQMVTSEDVMNYADPTSNAPALKSLVEVDQTLNGDLEVYFSGDNGAGYDPVERLMPVTTVSPAHQLRVAFVNHGAERCYLAAYAVIF